MVLIAQQTTKNRTDQRHFRTKLVEYENAVGQTLGVAEAAQQQLAAWVEEVVSV